MNTKTRQIQLREKLLDNLDQFKTMNIDQITDFMGCSRQTIFNIRGRLGIKLEYLKNKNVENPMPIKKPEIKTDWRIHNNARVYDPHMGIM